MSDAQLRAAERDWRASQADPERIATALAAFERAGQSPPWELLAVTPRWERVVAFFRTWFAGPIEARHGCTPADVARAEERVGRPLPPAVREWYLLAGRHPDLPGLCGRAAWGFNELCASDALQSEAGWVELGCGHQGGVRWLVWLEDPLARVFVSGGVEDVEDDGAAAIGSVEDFALAFLVEEFAWGGARGRGPGVRHATYWNVPAVTAAAQAAYAPLPRTDLYLGGRRILGDDDTFLVIADPEPAYVMTRTDAAWERAVARFGAPRPGDLRS